LKMKWKVPSFLPAGLSKNQQPSEPPFKKQWACECGSFSFS
jgi:hypothetical protein